MARKVEVVLVQIEKATAIVSIVVSATRKVVALLESNKAE